MDKIRMNREHSKLVTIQVSFLLRRLRRRGEGEGRGHPAPRQGARAPCTLNLLRDKGYSGGRTPAGGSRPLHSQLVKGQGVFWRPNPGRGFAPLHSQLVKGERVFRGHPNTVQIRRGDKRGRTKTKRQSRWHTQAIKHFKQERTCLMIATIPENGLQDKVCQHLSLGLLQNVLPVSQIEEL